MQEFGEGKDGAIVDFLRELGNRASGWRVEDHWEGDRCAIGLVDPASPGRLAYVSSWRQAAGRYYIELEVTGRSADEYEVISMVESCALADGVGVVLSHWEPR